MMGYANLISYFEIYTYFEEVYMFFDKISLPSDHTLNNVRSIQSGVEFDHVSLEQNANKTTTKIYFILWQKYVDVCWRWRTISLVVLLLVRDGGYI